MTSIDLAWDRRDLSVLMQLDALGGDRFAAACNETNAYSTVFGGQLLGQALAAADATAPNRTAHSIYTHFIRAGSPGAPIEYEVERLRDGGRFSLRRVTGRQGGAVLLSATCSYRAQFGRFDHQQPRAGALSVEDAIDVGELARSGRAGLPTYFARFETEQPVEMRIAGEAGFLAPSQSPRREFWLRVPAMARQDNPAIHRQALAYLTDVLLPGTSLAPHTLPLPGPHVYVASLSHAIWFHRPVRCDDWLSFETDSPSASGGVALSRGLIYDSEDRLVATVAQEAFQIPVDADAP